MAAYHSSWEGLLMCGVITHTPSPQTSLICQLQSGDSFGENVVFEDTRLAPHPPAPPPSSFTLLMFNRQTMVVTKDYCELLYVEAENIRRIYQVCVSPPPLTSPIPHLFPSTRHTRM